jgi:hypothetical protein
MSRIQLFETITAAHGKNIIPFFFTSELNVKYMLHENYVPKHMPTNPCIFAAPRLMDV